MSGWPLIKFLPQQTNLRFVALAPVLCAISAILCAASLYLTLVPFQPPCGGLNCGVDFRGGTVLELDSDNHIDLARARDVLGAMDIGDVQVQAFGDVRSAMIRFETPPAADAAAAVDNVKTRLANEFGGVRFPRTEVVGPKVSGELLGKGVAALLCGIGLMLLYIWFRFGLTFGLAAVLALAHDVLLTFGLFAITQMEFTLTAVGSILTIIGYSINDKIVVLDRVRENMRKFKKVPLREIIDLSVNETLSRTIITGITGVMALVVMAIFGGDALFAFSVAMIFGIVVGTYSSIYVAAPSILLLSGKRGEKLASEEPAPQKAG